MKNFIKKYILAFLLTSFSFSISQAQKLDYKVVDEYVRSLGSLDSMNMGTISHTLTKRFPDNIDKLRAIFDWIALNIQYDCKAGRSGNNSKPYYAEDVLKTRKATSAGYASLFQDMCSVAKIRCLTVDGYTKRTIEELNEKPDEFNHTWAVVQLGQSPESWFYVDPAMGSGFTNEKMTVFTPLFNDAFFFADKKIFNFQHFPDNPAWHLGIGNKNLKDFLSLPLVKDVAYEYELKQFIPLSGYIKSKVKKPVEFSISINPNTNVEIVTVTMGDEKKKKTKTTDYTYTNGTIRFSYKFEEEDSYPVTISINNKEVLKYFAEVTE